MSLVYPQLVTGADLLRGITKLSEVVPLMKQRGATAAAIVNAKLYGVRSFYKMLKKYDIHPVIGLNVSVALSEEKVVPIYVYAQNNAGLQNLMKISSAIATKEEEVLPFQWLEAYCAHCSIVLPVTTLAWQYDGNEEKVSTVIAHMQKATVFLGISRLQGQIHEFEAQLVQFAEKKGLPIVAVYESRFVHPEDAAAYQTAKAIVANELVENLAPLSVEEEQYYLLPAADIQAAFHNRPEWLHETEKLLHACTVSIEQTDFLLPKFPVIENMDAIEQLRQNCARGLTERIGDISELYEKRLAYELQVIEQMGYEDYFLIVEDFIAFSRAQHILTGPGRGSSAGSLVAYALKITDVDPIRYGLIFERFLNPERITMPDIDIDFVDNRRQEVIEYVASKYGKKHTAQIITFGTLSVKAVARNVARVFGFSNEEMAFISKAIPNGSSMTIQLAVEQSRPLREWIAMDATRQRWFEVAAKLEGLPRNASTHAAGVVLSPQPLVETVPLQKGSETIYLTQWAMGDVEEAGLLKMDFLGLRNLTLLDRIRKMIYFDRKQFLDFEKIPFHDAKTFSLFQQGNMTGIFQFESVGMRDTLRLIRPDRFEDLYAISALYRPGPMDFIPMYARRKHGQESVTYIHPELEPILSDTYGVIVYQEQIMQIAYTFARYSMGEADLLRRAISKKNRQVLLQEREKFVDRAIENGITQEVAKEIYNLIVKFADYGFPKSHAVAYSMISYQLAYLKANEPAYFYAALLSTTGGNSEKVQALIQEVRHAGITILPPSIRKSNYSFSVEEGAIRIGLGLIKGISHRFYEQFQQKRANESAYKTLFDLSSAMGSELFTEKNIVPLIKSGALDEMRVQRAVLLASIDAAIAHAKFTEPSKGGDMLADYINSITSPKYSPAEELPKLTLLRYEKEVLGFYLSEHPITEWKKTVSFPIVQISEAIQEQSRKVIRVVGFIQEIKRIRTKKGEEMAFVTIQDETGILSCTFFPRQYHAFAEQLQEERFIIIEGTTEVRKGMVQILVQTSDVVAMSLE